MLPSLLVAHLTVKRTNHVERAKNALRLVERHLGFAKLLVDAVSRLASDVHFRLEWLSTQTGRLMGEIVRLVEIEDVRIFVPVLAFHLVRMLVDSKELPGNRVILLPPVQSLPLVIDEFHLDRAAIRFRPYVIGEPPLPGFT